MEKMTDQFPCVYCGNKLGYAAFPPGMMLSCPYCRNTFVFPIVAEAVDPACVATPSHPGAYRPESPTQDLFCQPPVPVHTPLDYIVPDVPRPAGITILGLLGIIFSSLGLLVGIIVVLDQAGALYGLAESQSHGSVLVMANFMVRCLFMLGFIHISIGLLRRRKSARWSFVILAVLIVLLEMVQVTTTVFGQGESLDIKIDFFRTVSLLYLISGLIYLQFRNAKNWFA